MASQEKLDAKYCWQQEQLIAQAVTVFLEQANKHVQLGEDKYVHKFLQPCIVRVLPEVVRRLAADGYRVKLAQKNLVVIRFVPDRPSKCFTWFARKKPLRPDHYDPWTGKD